MALTCIACKLLFSVPELHQEHYKSDWHRYNLKRRITKLPPVTKEEFQEKAAAFETNYNGKNVNEFRCASCNKNFSSANTVHQHMKSKKHLEIKTDQGKKGTAFKSPKEAVKTLAMETTALEDVSDEEWEDWESCDEDSESTTNINSDNLNIFLDDSVFELVLPSGTSLGHRSLALYYKQNLKPVASSNTTKFKKIIQQYKGLGYAGTSGPAAVKRDIGVMQRTKNKCDLKLALKQNLLQPHFRSQVMF